MAGDTYYLLSRGAGIPKSVLDDITDAQSAITAIQSAAALRPTRGTGAETTALIKNIKMTITHSANDTTYSLDEFRLIVVPAQ